MFENTRTGRQARYFTTNVPKILDLKSSFEQIFSENCRWVPLLIWQNQKPHGKNKIPHGKNKNLTAKPKTSRQKQKPHGKTENLTAKTKYLTTKAKTSRQNQRPHDKTKYFTVETKIPTYTSGQKQIPTAKPKLFCFCCEVFGFAVRFLVLPWGILFSPLGCWFCRDVFVFAERFLVLPWQLWATVQLWLTATKNAIGKADFKL